MILSYDEIMKNLSKLISVLSLLFSFTVAHAMEKLNQGDYSILATELSANKTVTIYLLPFGDLDPAAFNLSFQYFKNGRTLSATVDKNSILKSDKTGNRVVVNDISGSKFSMEGPIIRVEYDLRSQDEIWKLMTSERKGRLSFKHISNSNIYFDRYYYRFDPASKLVSLPSAHVAALGALKPSSIKLPISLVLTSLFDINNAHHRTVFLTNLKAEVDTYWLKQCNIELEFKSVRAFTPNDPEPFSIIPDLNPEYFVMESWFRGEKSIPVVSGKSAIGAEGMAIMLSNWNVRNVKEMLTKVKNPNMVIFSHGEASKRDANTLAHELGHVLLQTGHSTDRTNLMSAGGLGARELPKKITKQQCETAKTFLKAL